MDALNPNNINNCLNKFVMNYMNLLNSNNIILPKELIPYFRSNHAGETGAVYIYKAILNFQKIKISKFSSYIYQLR